MREMQQEQMEEKEVEAQIQGMILWFYGTQTDSCGCLNAHLVLWAGVSVNGIKVEQAECDLDDRVYWLVYFHVHLLHVINLMAGI